MKNFNWKESIQQKYSIKYIDINDQTELSFNDSAIWTTRCCKIKNCKKGLPIEMYHSYITNRFFTFVINNNLPYGIISDKYGLHLSNEKLDSYNIHPSKLTMDEKVKLGTKICKIVTRLGYSRIIFYNNSPLLSKPYFEMLSNTGLKVYYITKLLPTNYN